jgi:hypothetical protein
MSNKEESMLSKLFSLNPFRKSSEESRPNLDENQVPANPINELQILNAHTDIVRIVLKLDELRYTKQQR